MTTELPRSMKRFNQVLLAEHCLSETQAHQLWASLDDDNNDNMDFKTLLYTVNEQLQQIGLEVRGVIINKERYYSIVNIFPDAIAQTTMALPENTHVYMNRVYQKLAEEGPTTKAALLNDRDKLTLPAAETVLEHLIDAKWVEFVDPHKKGQTALVQLAPRSYMELSHLLTTSYGMDKADMPQVMFYKP